MQVRLGLPHTQTRRRCDAWNWSYRRPMIQRRVSKSISNPIFKHVSEIQLREIPIDTVFLSISKHSYLQNKRHPSHGISVRPPRHRISATLVISNDLTDQQNCVLCASKSIVSIFDVTRILGACFAIRDPCQFH